LHDKLAALGKVLAEKILRVDFDQFSSLIPKRYFLTGLVTISRRNSLCLEEKRMANLFASALQRLVFPEWIRENKSHVKSVL